jgi:CHAT domain
VVGPDVLRLEAREFVGPTRWRWVLSDARGVFLADQQVDLDPQSPEFKAMTRLQFRVRWQADPQRPLASEAEFLDRVGRWMGQQVLGEVGEALVERSPATALVVVPTGAEVLVHWPLELAWAEGAPLAVQDVSLVLDVGADGQRPAKAPIDQRLRMLAVFSLPAEDPLLVLRQQRHELVRLIDRIALTKGKAIERVTLQYGVTRERLRRVLEEGEGWDLVHFSGHGLATELVLEGAGGTRDPVPTEQVLRLLRPGRSRLKLLVLSSCDSGAAAGNEALRVGEAGADQAGAEPDEPAPLPALALAAVQQLDCAVLGMRYRVGDDFSIRLAQHLYDSLLGDENLLPRALQLALPKALGERPEPGSPPLSVATPALFGRRAVDLSLSPPAAPAPTFSVANTKMAFFPPEPDRFVGRIQPMTTASRVLAGHDGDTGVLFAADGPTGKTACALEVVYRYEDRFQALAWHQAPTDEGNLAGALRQLAIDLERQLRGFAMVDALASRAALDDFLPRLTELLERHAILVVLDGIGSLLTPDGRWRDPWWELLITAMLDHTGLSRLVVSSRRRPASLPARLLVVPVPPLAPLEALLLARQLPNLGGLLRGHTNVSMGGVVPLLADALAAAQGLPGVIAAIDRQFPARDTLEELPARVAELARPATPDAAAPGREQYLALLQEWTRGVGQP